MLPKKKRIPRSLFKEIIEQSSKASLKPRFFHSRHFLVRIVEGESGEDARAAVSVSKKVSKSAVVRNRTRRRVYSILAHILPSMKNGLYLLSAKPGADKLKVEELRLEVEELLSNTRFVHSLKKG